jgi:hypothetical protein
MNARQTPWFPPWEPPVRTGVYIVKNGGMRYCCWYDVALARWEHSAATPTGVMQARASGADFKPPAHDAWRGFLKGGGHENL